MGLPLRARAYRPACRSQKLNVRMTENTVPDPVGSASYPAAFRLRDYTGSVANFITDEWQDFLDNFDHLERSISAYRQGNQSEFKWVILTLFMGLQSLFVVCLKNTDFHNVTRNNGKKKGYRFVLCCNWDAGKVEIDHDKREVRISTHSQVHRRLDQLEQIQAQLPGGMIETEFAEVFHSCWMLVDFAELYRRVKSGQMKQFIDSKPLPALPRFDSALEMLINLRNQFIHFVPKLWEISEGHLQTVIVPCLEIMRFLLLESGNTRTPEAREIGIRAGKLHSVLQEDHSLQPRRK